MSAFQHSGSHWPYNGSIQSIDILGASNSRFSMSLTVCYQISCQLGSAEMCAIFLNRTTSPPKIVGQWLHIALFVVCVCDTNKSHQIHVFLLRWNQLANQIFLVYGAGNLNVSPFFSIELCQNSWIVRVNDVAALSFLPVVRHKGWFDLVISLDM